MEFGKSKKKNNNNNNNKLSLPGFNFEFSNTKRHYLSAGAILLLSVRLLKNPYNLKYLQNYSILKRLSKFYKVVFFERDFFNHIRLTFWLYSGSAQYTNIRTE